VIPEPAAESVAESAAESVAESVAEAASGRMSYAQALASREFRALFAGQFLEVGGVSIAAVALTVLVYRRTASPFLASLTFALTFIPYLFAGGLLSALVDRVRPRRLMTTCDTCSAGLVAVMAIPGLPLPILFTILFCSGTLASISGGARAALTRATVSADAYVPARSLLRVAAQLAQLGGNAGGGALLLVISTRGVLFVNSGALLMAAAIVRLAVADHANTGERGARMLLGESLRGVRMVLADRPVRQLMLLNSIGSMFFVAPEAVAASYVAAHHARSSVVGLWLIALPVGLIAADVAGVRLLSASQRRGIFAPAAVWQFIPYLAFIADPAIPLAIVLIASAGLSGLYLLEFDVRLRDAASPELFARVMTINTSVLIALQGLGFALAGAVAQATTPADAIFIAGVAGSIVTLSLLRDELGALAHGRERRLGADLPDR
jgi:hypothetical protein